MKLKQLTFLDFLQKVKNGDNRQLPEMTDLIKGFQVDASGICFWPSLVYVIDYTTLRYLYISPGAEALLGYPASVLLEAGPQFFMSRIHPDDFTILNNDIFPVNLGYLTQHQLSATGSPLFTVSYRFKNEQGDYREISQRSGVISYGKDNTPLAAAGCIINLTNLKTDRRMLHMIEDGDPMLPGGKREVLVNYYQPGIPGTGLSKREIDVLKEVRDGCSSKLIANKLHLSIHTINNHRKNMLHKSRCKNISELLNHSIKNGVL